MTAAALAPGTLFAKRYEIVRVLKTGGMGAVYEVTDAVTHRRRALKLMLPALVADPALRERFARETTVAARVESDHLVETFDAGVDEDTGSPFLVMELLRGEDLEATLERRGALPPKEVVTLLSQVGLALDKTHAAGIVHRDLKPANLFLARRDDGSPHVVILDFGIAKLVAEGAGASATIGVGTPIYMPPEQLSGGGDIGPWSDLYALGHVAFTMIAGKAYWEEDLAEVKELYPLLTRILRGVRESPVERAKRRGIELPNAFDAWFARATAAERAPRFASARELVRTLAGALGIAAPESLEEPIDPVAPTARPVEEPLAAMPHHGSIAHAPTTPAVALPDPRSEALAPRPPRPIEAATTQHAVSTSSGNSPPRSRKTFIVGAVIGVGLAVTAIVGSAIQRGLHDANGVAVKPPPVTAQPTEVKPAPIVTVLEPAESKDLPLAASAVTSAPTAAISAHAAPPTKPGAVRAPPAATVAAAPTAPTTTKPSPPSPAPASSSGGPVNLGF